jgi:PhzF family phenazine biosynthesis protein
MTIKIYQIDAFTDNVFGGNPAAVCPLQVWPDDEVLQNIALENNLSETAFYVKNDNEFKIRWFTPVTEVDLCGHATLATAFVIFEYEQFHGDEIIFHSRSGILKVRKNEEQLCLNFPADRIEAVDIPENSEQYFGIKPLEAYKGVSDLMFVFSSQKEISNMDPNYHLINSLDARGIIVTAKGDDVDFVSRFFCPQVGINEDPVTGSAHTTLTPYWGGKLNKSVMTALQLSKRKGSLQCALVNNRVEISGKAVTYLIGQINI